MYTVNVFSLELKAHHISQRLDLGSDNFLEDQEHRIRRQAENPGSDNFTIELLLVADYAVYEWFVKFT